MAFTMDPVQAPNPGPASATIAQPSEFNLPTKEFVGYDPKGTTTITGSPIERPDAATVAAPAEAKVYDEDTVKLPAKVSALLRKEQAQRAEAAKFAKEKAEFAAQLEKAKKFDEIQAKLAAKDYTAVDDLGVQYEEFVKHEINREAGKDPVEQRARKLEEEIANIKKAQEERDLEDYKTNQSLWKEEITKTTTGSEKFPEINYRKSKGEDVDQIILQHVNDSFDEDGVRLTADKAAEEIENFLKARAEFYAESPTVKKASGNAKVMGPPKAGPKTITQQMTTTPKTAPASKPFHLMSESEQIAEAIRRVQAAKLNR